VGTYLDTILAAHRDAASRDDRSFDDLLRRTDGLPATRSFADALCGSSLRVIAEIKRRSPSKGDLNVDLDPAAVAAEYERGGAACLSVLTDTEFFGGAPSDLVAARGACSLPVLRKDFTVDRRDVVDARLMGADAILLIVAALDDDELASLQELATSLGLAALVEVHDERELDRAVDAGASIIGVNQRDLTTFEIDRELAAKLAPRMPDGIVRVAESGIRDADDALAVATVGYDAVLVGESVVTSGDHAAAVAALAEVRR
jgi:indole-3-glycerol phosphate synthase